MTGPSRQPDVEVFTQHHCASCRQVENYLEKRGVAFTTRDVVADKEALDEIFRRGFMTTPVIRIDNAWVGGFRRDEIERLLPT